MSVNCDLNLTVEQVILSVAREDDSGNIIIATTTETGGTALPCDLQLTPEQVLKAAFRDDLTLAIQEV